MLHRKRLNYCSFKFRYTFFFFISPRLSVCNCHAVNIIKNRINTDLCNSRSVCQARYNKSVCLTCSYYRTFLFSTKTNKSCLIVFNGETYIVSESCFSLQIFDKKWCDQGKFVQNFIDVQIFNVNCEFPESFHFDYIPLRHIFCI